MTVLAFDIGGTRVKAGLVDAGRVAATATETTDTSRAATSLLQQLVKLGRQLTAPSAAQAVGISVRGIVSPDSGLLVDVNPPLTCLVGQPLAVTLSAEFGAPAKVENDARMYALGELRHGAGRGTTSMVCLTLGTGVGVGVALERRILRGPRGVLGVLGGHFTVDVDGPLCSCGNVGCLEALIGSGAIVAYAAERVRDQDRSALASSALDPEAIFAAAAMNDPVATDTVERFTRVLAAGVVTLIHAYDPDLVIVGGGISGSAALFLPQVQEYVDAHAWTHPKGRVRLEVAELGDSAALVGAAELCLEDDSSWLEG